MEDYFKNRIKTLRKEKKITQSKLAKKLNYSRSTIAQYESGTRVPSINFLIETSNFFNVSLDYLLGRTDIRLSFQNYLSKYTESILLFINPENGKIVDYSPGALNFYGYTEKEFSKKTIFNLNILPKSKVMELMKKARSTHKKNFHFQHRLANGEIKDVKVTTTTLVIGETRVLGSLIQDITNINHKSKIYSLNDSLIKLITNFHANKLPYKKHYAENVAKLSYLIGSRLSLANDNLEKITKAAMLHDLGEIILPAAILNKAAELTKSEYIILKQHPQIAYDMLKDVDFDEKVNKIILQHHERLDGSGYPNGLKNNEIFLEAKILGTADSVVAMLSKRPYRDSYSFEKTIEEIERYKNIKYDADIIDTVIKIFAKNEFLFK
ncbi:MAG: HD domain-containing phosphohydrolase [Bacillota bacterium]